jgi:endoglucanase
LNLHRGPGYCINPPAEPLNLWEDEEAQRQFDFQWLQFARRYKGIPSSQLSFDLLNEPARTQREVYVNVVRRAVKAIRSEDSDRLIISDGFQVGREPVFEFTDLGIAQSTRGYAPSRLTHYKASWVQGESWPEPTWPLRQGDQLLDRDWLYQTTIRPWKKLEEAGVGVHIGEWGAYRPVPYPVALSWMRDCLSLWNEAGWGWALWNLRGGFGIVDSEREGATYEQFHGHQLDRKMLALLQQS